MQPRAKKPEAGTGPEWVVSLETTSPHVELPTVRNGTETSMESKTREILALAS